ncbi:MAG: hypothetical protein RI909_785 [Bacteroidota bacterium]|jgi:hypothetical protein
MKKILFVIYALAASSVLMQCSPKKQEEPIENNASVTPAAQLTDEQKAEGWQLLFDGQTTQGWQIFKARENNTWEVVDGTLHCKALDEKVMGVGDKRSDIMTTAQYDNFELAFDWKISTQGNTGVMFRVTEEFEQPYYSGPEYQLMDDVGFPNETPDHLSGSNYGVHAAGKTSLKPTGEWNTSKLVVNKNHVEHWLNGEKLVDYELNSPEWLALKKASKWNEATGYGAAPKGHIVFQDHGSEAWFRNIMIKTL